MPKKASTKKQPVTKPSVKEYAAVLLKIKEQVIKSQAEAAISLNLALNKRNWIVGKIIFEEQAAYGTNFLENVAKDLQNMFPGNTGFSRANVYRMSSFYGSYQNCRAAARQIEALPIFHIPWFHNVVLLQRVKNPEERLWYAQKALELGWSRSALESNIESKLFKRAGKAVTNFKKTIPDNHAIAQQAFKDPYNFDFLTLEDDHIEHDLERGLISNVQKLLLEMGKGFALIGRQYPLPVEDEDYYIDLLFYHVHLKCYIVVELKARAFKASDIGQINFYLSAVDDLVKAPEDKPTIGLLLCRSKKNVTAEYALRNVNSPIGVAGYEAEIINKLPKEFKRNLPSVEELEKELEKTERLSQMKIPTGE